MKLILSIGIATAYGLSMRLVYGMLHDIMGIMTITFLIILPMIIGLLTTFFVASTRKITAGSAFGYPWITSFVLLILTIFLLIEGMICWIIIFPLFAILAGLGGLIAYYSIIKPREARKNSESNSSSTKLKMSFILLLPLVFGPLEGDRTLVLKEMTITEQITIHASQATVWEALLNIDEVESGEKETNLANALGFPEHIRTTLDTAAVGGKRIAYYERGLFFEETISEFEQEKRLVLDIDVDPDKIPPTVMDEHILIGGKHVDVIRDIYKLKELPDGTTQISLSSTFIINTPFNWYTQIWAKYLMKDLLKGELKLIQKRSSKLE